MNRLTVPLVAVVIAVAGGRAEADFIHNFDMRGDYTQYLFSTTNAVVNNEAPSFPDVTYWAPASVNSFAEIVYKYDLPFTVGRADVYAWIGAFNNFDPGARAFLDVSADGVNWTTIASNFYDQPIPIDVSDILAGSNTAFVRGRLLETRRFGSIHYAQFLRTANGVLAPNVYQFRAQAVPEPSSLGLACVGIAILVHNLRRGKRRA